MGLAANLARALLWDGAGLDQRCPWTQSRTTGVSHSSQIGVVMRFRVTAVSNLCLYVQCHGSLGTSLTNPYLLAFCRSQASTFGLVTLMSADSLSP
jgi:hypothetical protein